jgi:rSAM/selenodomain-associated transferase 1
MNVGIFLKTPEPGKVKTRMCPPLTPLEAADLYACLLTDSLRAAAASRAARIVLFHEGPPPSEYLTTALVALLREPIQGDQKRLLEIPQSQGDLGERLRTAVASAEIEAALPLLLLGSDNPDLPWRHIDTALEALERYDLVLGPADDGGAWGIGVKSRCDQLFADIPWSANSTAEALRERAGELGLSTHSVAVWQDVDEIQDLREIHRRLAEDPAAAPATARWLKSWDGRIRHLKS